MINPNENLSFFVSFSFYFFLISHFGGYSKHLLVENQLHTNKLTERSNSLDEYEHTVCVSFKFKQKRIYFVFFPLLRSHNLWNDENSPIWIGSKRRWADYGADTYGQDIDICWYQYIGGFVSLFLCLAVGSLSSFRNLSESVVHRRVYWCDSNVCIRVPRIPTRTLQARMCMWMCRCVCMQVRIKLAQLVYIPRIEFRSQRLNPYSIRWTKNIETYAQIWIGRHNKWAIGPSSVLRLSKHPQRFSIWLYLAIWQFSNKIISYFCQSSLAAAIEWLFLP